MKSSKNFSAVSSLLMAHCSKKLAIIIAKPLKNLDSAKIDKSGGAATYTQ